MNKKKFIFGTKSENLIRLNKRLKNSIIPNLIYFNINQWKISKKSILLKINNAFENNKIVVRSSGLNEDGHKSSLAGKFLSLLNVKNNNKNIVDSVNKVIKYYGSCNGNNQVIIQKQVEHVKISGVIFTRDINDGSEYYTITYDDFSGLTNTVTSGLKAKSIVVYERSFKKLKSNRFRKLIRSIKEIEKETNSKFLDIEFCIDSKENIFILQVRPLIVKNLPAKNNQIYKKINSIKIKLIKIL